MISDDAVMEARALRRIAEAQGNEIEARSKDLLNMRIALEERHAREGAALKILQMTEEETRRRRALEERMRDRVTVGQLEAAMEAVALPRHISSTILNEVHAHIVANKAASTSAPTPTHMRPGPGSSSAPRAAQGLLGGDLPTSVVGYKDLLLSL